MSKIRKTLLHSVLAVSFALFPVSGFGALGEGDDPETNSTEQPNTEMNDNIPSDDSTLPQIEQTAGRFHVGVYYGRPYYYRPYYYYYPYRPYYYHQYYYYPYRPYGGYYGW